MKKWLISYLFVSCSICIHMDGFANAVKKSRTTATIKSSYKKTQGFFTFKKASQDLTDLIPRNSSNIFFQYGSLRILYPVTSYFTAAPNFFFAFSNHVPGKLPVKKEVERVLKDHLLHLFPSHYFW